MRPVSTFFDIQLSNSRDAAYREILKSDWISFRFFWR